MNLPRLQYGVPTLIPKRLNSLHIERNTGLLKDVFSSLLGGEWASAGRASQTLRGHAYAKAMEIARSDESITAFAAASGDSFASLNEMMDKATDDEAGLRKLFIKNADKLGGLNSRKMKRAWVLMTNPEIRNQYLDLLQRFYNHPFSNLNWEWPMKMGVVGLYSQVLTSFQETAASRRGAPAVDELETALLDALAANGQKVMEFLSEAQQKLQLEDRAALRDVAIKHINQVELLLDDMAAWLTSADSILASARDSRLKTRLREAAEVCLDAAAEVRFCIWSYAVGFHLLKLSGLPETDKVWRQAARRALELPLASAVEDGVNATVKQLMNKPADYAGRLVEVTGQVKELRGFRESENKVTTMFRLADVADEKVSVEASLPYSNLSTRGLLNDCIIHLNGEVYLSKQDDKYRLRLDRLAYSELKKHSWLDALANDINKIFPLWPERLNAVWSYKPGADWTLASGIFEIFHLAKLAD